MQPVSPAPGAAFASVNIAAPPSSSVRLTAAVSKTGASPLAADVLTGASPSLDGLVEPDGSVSGGVGGLPGAVVAGVTPAVVSALPPRTRCSVPVAPVATIATAAVTTKAATMTRRGKLIRRSLGA